MDRRLIMKVILNFTIRNTDSSILSLKIVKHKSKSDGVKYDVNGIN